VGVLPRTRSRGPWFAARPSIVNPSVGAMSSPGFHQTRVFVLVAVVALGAASARSATPWHDDFEDATLTWQVAGGDVRYVIHRHERASEVAYAGRSSEWLQFTGQSGTTLYLSHDVGRPRIIPELHASVWVKADRPGIQVFARAVLPRTKDPRSGTPVMLRLEGTSYTQVGRWQQLRIDDFPQLLTRRIRGVRFQMGSQVDGREAYIDRILLNVYGGTGTTNVWTDELNLDGFVDSSPSPGVMPGMVPVASSAPLAANAADRVDSATVLPASPLGQTGRGRRLRLVGPVVQLDDQPVLPRAIRHRGESFARLKQLGFNTVWLPCAPSPAALTEADRLGLMLVCPPPDAVLSWKGDDPMAPSPRLGPEYDVVLAWDLGSGLTEQHLESVRQLASRMRAAAEGGEHYLTCWPDSCLRAYSGMVNFVTVGQSPLATSLELTDYGQWIRHRSRFVRTGRVIWSTVQTQPSVALREQWAAGGRQASLPPEITVEQIRLMAYMAIAAGSRGLLFESDASLESGDPETASRAVALELVNLELELARPWVAAGQLIEVVQAKDLARDRPDVSAAVFRCGRTHLLVPLWSGPGAQYVPGQAAENELKFVVPGVPDSSRAYEITPRGMEPVRSRNHVTGGIEVTLGEFSLCSMILFAGDDALRNDMREQVRLLASRAARPYRQLAVRKLAIVDDVQRRTAAHAETWLAGEQVAAARKYLQSCDAALAAHNDSTACLAADRAMRMLRLVERANWEAAVRSLRSPTTSPATVCFATLPWHWSLVDQTRSWRLGPNLIAGGDFESLSSVTSAGWDHFQHVEPNVLAHAEVAARAARSGQAGLRLVTLPAKADSPPGLVETPPLWITSPAVNVDAGVVVRFSGWVHIPTPLVGSVDGLLIYDSITGEALAERLGETTGWQPFSLYRIATRSGPVSLTLALSGLGEVWLDDVAVQVLSPTAAAPLGQSPTLPARRF
jgi:hypothetical protein